MTEGPKPRALDERLQHEIGNAMMVVVSFAEVIDHRFPEDAVVHDAVRRIKDAVVRSKAAVDDARRELGDVARRLSASAIPK